MLAARSQLPWLCYIIFDDTASPCEKYGVALRPSSFILGFGEALTDVIQLSSSFTYNYREGTTYYMCDKLNRASCISSWTNYFLEAVSTIIIEPILDYNRTLIEVERTEHSQAVKCFRWKSFNNSWLVDSTLGTWLVILGMMVLTYPLFNVGTKW